TAGARRSVMHHSRTAKRRRTWWPLAMGTSARSRRALPRRPRRRRTAVRCGAAVELRHGGDVRVIQAGGRRRPVEALYQPCGRQLDAGLLGDVERQADVLGAERGGPPPFL